MILAAGVVDKGHHLMYLDFYGFRAEPFHITPDPDFLYLSPSHKEALAAIIYGVQQRKGFITITGEIGLGKTTIVRSYLERYDRSRIKTVLVFNANVSFTGLLRVIYRELGLEPPDLDPYELVHHLHTILIKEYQDGWNVVLIIDEAQNMPVETLENLRMLSNLESTKDKLIQIILIGQPELENTLNLHQLRQLKQRIAIRTTIKPLTPQESLDYIRHRLSLVHSTPREVFTSGALELIIKEAQGIPRKINIICDNAFITGFGYGRKPVTEQIVREVIADLEGRTQIPRRRGRKIALAGLCAFVLAVALLRYPEAPRAALMWVVDGVKRVQSLTGSAGALSPAKGLSEVPSKATETPENTAPRAAPGLDSEGHRIVKPLPFSEKGPPGPLEGASGQPLSEKETLEDPAGKSDGSKNKNDQSSALQGPAKSRDVLFSSPQNPRLSLALLEQIVPMQSFEAIPAVPSTVLSGAQDSEKRRLAAHESPQKKRAAQIPEKTTGPDRKGMAGAEGRTQGPIPEGRRSATQDARAAPSGGQPESPPTNPQQAPTLVSAPASTTAPGPSSTIQTKPFSSAPETTVSGPPVESSQPTSGSDQAPPSPPPAISKPSGASNPEVPQPDPGRVIDWLLNRRSESR